MYCPRCSHQAASDNVRFCPGCGFRLDGVAELLANDRLLAADEEKTPKPRRSMVKRGALLGTTLMFIVTLMFLLNLRLGAIEEAVLRIYSLCWAALMSIIGVSGFVKRLITKIYNGIAKIFSEEESSPSKKIASPRGAALPAAYSAPVADSSRQFVDTTKMGHPSSITEQTTSRLNRV